MAGGILAIAFVVALVGLIAVAGPGSGAIGDLGTTAIPAAPASPTSIGSMPATISWNDTSANESGFELWRRAGSGSYALPTTTLANVRSYLDTSVAPNTSYTYTVRAYNSAGSSPFSPEVTLSTLPSAPGRIEDSDPRLVYVGTWNTRHATQVSGGSARVASLASATATLTFNGTGATVLMVKGPQLGTAKITLDGVSTTVDLYNPTNQLQQAVFSKAGLPGGTHVLVVAPTGQKNPKASGTGVALDALDLK